VKLTTLNISVEPFDDRSTKKMLLDLVRSHTPPSQTSAKNNDDRLEVDDIIPGKGKGLVVLLYGRLFLPRSFPITGSERTSWRW
jgi:hypothetical protein